MNFFTFLMSLRAKRSNLLLMRRLCRHGVTATLRQTIVLLIMILMTSCAALDELLLATPIPITPTETPPPTSTIIWFPPSPTPTPRANAAPFPTPEMRPGLGDILIEDDFSDPSLWTLAVANQSSAVIENNRLTLSVQSGANALSLRNDLLLTDFYAEITAKPSLCRGEDNYGLLIRADSVSSYYRFVLACNGTVRAERLLNGNRLPLQAPLPSADAPPGAPGEVRIGVWAVGRDIRFFLNGRFQFSISEPAFRRGSIGVFVRSAENTAVIVSFSDLVIQKVEGQ